MKKFLLLLLFIPLVSFGQEYSLGKKINLNFLSADIISLNNPDGWQMSKEKTELSNFGNIQQTIVFNKDLSTKITITLRSITDNEKLVLEKTESFKSPEGKLKFFFSNVVKEEAFISGNISVEKGIESLMIGDRLVVKLSLILNRIYVSHRFKFINNDQVITLVGEGLKSESEKLKSFLPKLISSIEINNIETGPKSLSEYSDLMDSYYSSQPNLAIETFEKVVAEFSEKDIMVYSGLIKQATVAYKLLIAIQLGEEKVWKELKGTSLKLIEHIEKWKIPDPKSLKIAHRSFVEALYSEGFKDGTDLNSFEKFCESYLISKELGQVYLEEDNKNFNKSCNIFVLEENLDKSKLYLEIYEKGKKDKVDEDLTGILNLAVAYNKNSVEALVFLSHYMIEKIQKGLDDEDEDLHITKKIEKIKSINEQLTNNVDSKEAQYAGNFLNATLYSTILMTDMVKSTKGLSKSERIKIKSDLQKKMKESNEYKSSIFFFNEALKIVPKDFNVINSKAQIEEMVEDYENACKDWKTLKEIMEKGGMKAGNLFYDNIIDSINEHCN